MGRSYLKKCDLQLVANPSDSEGVIPSFGKTYEIRLS